MKRPEKFASDYTKDMFSMFEAHVEQMIADLPARMKRQPFELFFDIQVEQLLKDVPCKLDTLRTIWLQFADSFGDSLPLPDVHDVTFGGRQLRFTWYEPTPLCVAFSTDGSEVILVNPAAGSLCFAYPTDWNRFIMYTQERLYSSAP